MEPVARRRAKPLAILVAAIVLYWLAMFMATHLPFQTAPKNDPYSLDKIEHITAFAIFSLLLCMAGAFTSFSRLATYSGVLALVAAYAAIDELSQRLVPSRTADIRDWLADLFGASVGICLFAMIRRIYLLGRTRSASISKKPA